MRRTFDQAQKGQPQRLDGDLLGTPLEAVVLHFLERLADIATQEMRTRYDLGRIVSRIRHDPTGAFPTDALRRLAHAFDTHPSALRRSARVSEMISVDELEAVLALRANGGHPITWSHLELLTEVRGRDARWTLVQSILGERLSVRDLAARIRGIPKKQPVARQTVSPSRHEQSHDD
ncbi:hypothetical protein LVJ94_37695 [Pendulispora rubella]|uniref:Uncharacterized protein n=1 Tax=Pendulispora rubella TaxID=2741070 RepID=A0ABZ2KY00_9BACT